MSPNIRILIKINCICTIFYLFSGTAFRQIISTKDTTKSWFILIICLIICGGIKNFFNEDLLVEDPLDP